MKVAGDGLRRRARHVRGLRAQQVRLHGRDPVDAEQRVAVDDLALVRLLPAPGGGYFGTKKACEPMHIQYSYDDRSIVVVNSTYKPVSGMEASVRVVDFSLKEFFLARRRSM